MAWTTPKTDFANGDVLTAAEMNAVGNDLAYLYALPTPSFVAGKNKILNGDFGIWQRGTSLVLGASTPYTVGFTADRWDCYTSANQACTVSRQASSLAGTQYCLRFQRDSGQTGIATIPFAQSMESQLCVPLAGQSVTLSFYARAGANYSAASNALGVILWTGTGTDQNVINSYTGAAGTINQTATLTTSWQRFTYSATLPANTSEIAAYFTFTPTGTAGTNDYFEITGMQLEAGSVATPFTTATGNPASELAACQRYYYRQTSGVSFGIMGSGIAYSTTGAMIATVFPTQMRTVPTAVDYSAVSLSDNKWYGSAITSLILQGSTTAYEGIVDATVASGLTAQQFAFLRANNNSSAYIGFSAEL